MKRLWVAALGVALIVGSWGGASWAASSHGVARAPNFAKKPLKGCKAKGTVSFMFWGDKGEDIEQTALIKQAEKACPGLHVNGIWKQGGYDDALATGIGSGNAPDLFLLDTKRLPEFATRGALQQIDSYVKKDKLNLSKFFWKNCLPLTRYQGKTFGLERDCGNNGMIIFNKDMFDAKHVKYPTNKWTYNDLAKAAVALTGTYSTKTDPSSKLRFGIPIRRDDPNINQYIWAWGGNWISKDLHSCGLTSKAARSALAFWHDLAYKKHGASTPDQETAAGGQFDGFKNSRFAMNFVGPWALNYMVKPSSYTGSKPVSFHWGVALPPHGPKSGNGPLLSTVVAMYSKAKNRTSAWWLLKFLTLGKATQLLGQFGIAIPGDVSASHSTAFNTEYKPYTSTWLAGQKHGQWLRVVPNEDAFWDAVNKALTPYWNSSSGSVNAATSQACSSASSQLP